MKYWDADWYVDKGWFFRYDSIGFHIDTMSTIRVFYRAITIPALRYCPTLEEFK